MADQGKLLKKPQRHAPAAETAGRKSKGRVAPETQIKIGQHLRRFYSDIIDEGVPERFAELLRDLDKSE
jgi:Anti-sigma factor NepR